LCAFAVASAVYFLCGFAWQGYVSLPGHTLVVENGTLRTQPFWELPFPDGSGHGISDAEHAEQLLARLDEAVSTRLMSDVPLGALFQP